jgi:hypothetical protein
MHDNPYDVLVTSTDMTDGSKLRKTVEECIINGLQSCTTVGKFYC